MIASVESMRAGSGRRRILVFYDRPRVSKSKMRENQDFSKSGNGIMYYINIRSKWLSVSNIYVVFSEWSSSSSIDTNARHDNGQRTDGGAS